MTALPHVLASLTLTTRYHLTALEAAATVQLAEIQCELFGDTCRACHLLDSTQVSLPHCALATRVRARLLRVKCALRQDSPGKCHLALTLLIDLHGLTLLIDLRAAVTTLDALAAECARGGIHESLKEAYYLLACLHHELDQLAARDRYAMLFTELDRSLARTPNTHVYYLNSESIQLELAQLKHVL